MEINLLNGTGQALPAAPDAIPSERQAENREIIQAVKSLNAAGLFGQENELTFLLDRDTHRAIIRIVSRKTNEVIQQVPPEYVLRLAEQLREQK